MTIRRLFTCLFVITLIILGLVFASIYRVQTSSTDLRNAQEMRYRSYLLADELRQSSDDLTRLARTYVLTGEARYEQQYLDILAIRNGTKPRPAEYQRIYWDFVAAGEAKPRPDTQAMPLQELMKKAGFTDAEFAKLKEAQDNSNGLVKTETIAMNAVKGLYDDGSGNFTRKGPPDLERARRMMHDPDYHKAKALIMKPVDEFFLLLDRRTASAVQEAERVNAFWHATAIASIAAALAMLLAALYLVYRQILRQLGNEPRVVAHAVGRIAAGDLRSDIPVRPGDNSSLTHSLKTMQGSLSGIVRGIQEMAEAAVDRGDFSVKMEVAGRSGFMKDISDLLNRLSDVTEAGLKDITRVSSALAGGDLSHKIERNYPGLFGRTAADVNNTVHVLSELVAEMRRIADNASRGDFSQRIGLSDKRGFGADIGRLLNQLSDTTEVGLRDIIRVAQALAHGDLTQTIENDYPGLFGEARNGVNTTVTNLRELVRQIKEVADQIDTGAGEIARGNQDLSSRTEEQASSLEETASSMEELASTVKENESRVAKAGDIAASATEIATRGGEVVKASVATMAEITGSSKRIADIIGVIDGIAFQTNILALNAAVEAARAGEQGRGFAVVASEVRGLAQRSSEAARDIKNLISESVAQVENGTARVNLAGESMDGIVSGIRGVTDIMAEIRAASREQTTGIGQVAQAMAQMDEVTQQNAALVEEAAAAAESLKERAESLMRSVAAFNLGDSPAGARPAASGDAAVMRRPVPSGTAANAIAESGDRDRVARSRTA